MATKVTYNQVKDWVVLSNKSMSYERMQELGAVVIECLGMTFLAVDVDEESLVVLKLQGRSGGFVREYKLLIAFPHAITIEPITRELHDGGGWCLKDWNT